jgi:hypothetical protein
MLGLNGARVALGENLKPPSGARSVVTFLLLFAPDLPLRRALGRAQLHGAVITVAEAADRIHLLGTVGGLGCMGQVDRPPSRFQAVSRPACGTPTMTRKDCSPRSMRTTAMTLSLWPDSDIGRSHNHVCRRPPAPSGPSFAQESNLPQWVDEKKLLIHARYTPQGGLHWSFDKCRAQCLTTMR